MIDKNLYRFCGETKKYIKYSVFLQSISLLLGIGFAFSFSYLISLIQIHHTYSIFWIIPFMCAIVFAFLKVYLLKIIPVINFKIVKEVKMNLRKSIYEKALDLGLDYQENFSTQEINHIAVEGIEQLENYYGSYLSHFYYSIVSAFILFLAFLYIDFEIGLLLLIASLCIPLFLHLIMKIVKKVQRKYWKKYASVGDIFLESIMGINTLKIFRQDLNKAHEIDKKSEDFRKETMKVLAMQLNSIMLIDWIIYLTSAVAIIIGAKMFMASSINFFHFILIITLSAEFFVPMRILTSKFHIAMTGIAAGEKISEFLSLGGKEETESPVFSGFSNVTLKKLNFSYKNREKILKNINMKFKAGTLTSIVGESGSGKTTIGKLISSEIKVNNGLYFDDISVKEFNKKSIQKNVLRIPHSSHIFTATVRENILMGKEGITDSEIILLLKKLKLWNFLEKQDGLDTKIMSGGKNISGGQAQRIAIARGIISDFSVYIFDEASSNVDVDSEKIILDMIKELSKTKIVIFISHKMSAITGSDYVYVLKNSVISEEGKPSDLLKTSGLYSKLHKKQQDLINFGKRGIDYGK